MFLPLDVRQRLLVARRLFRSEWNGVAGGGQVLICLLLVSVACCGAACGQDSSSQSERPRALIIGDSISLGYTPFVKQLLQDELEVVHNKGNAQHTGTGLAKLDDWLGDERWEVIHFNWGLWDLCYRHPDSKTQGRRDKINGSVTFSVEDYEKNLDELVSRLKETEAVLIFATTTPVPEGELGRFVGDDVKYNAAALRVMERHEVVVNDLHAAILPRLAELQKPGGDVHFLRAGSEFLAEQVAAAIREAIRPRDEAVQSRDTVRSRLTVRSGDEGSRSTSRR